MNKALKALIIAVLLAAVYVQSEHIVLNLAEGSFRGGARGGLHPNNFNHTARNDKDRHFNGTNHTAVPRNGTHHRFNDTNHTGHPFNRTEHFNKNHTDALRNESNHKNETIHPIEANERHPHPSNQIKANHTNIENFEQRQTSSGSNHPQPSQHTKTGTSSTHPPNRPPQGSSSTQHWQNQLYRPLIENVRHPHQ